MPTYEFPAYSDPTACCELLLQDWHGDTATQENHITACFLSPNFNMVEKCVKEISH